MKRIPSFSSRPGFPRGLRVLMLDADANAREEAEGQLAQCGYAPITCSSIPDVLVHLASGPTSGDGQGGRQTWDLLLADLSFISPEVPDSSSLLSAAKSLPLILTHQGSPSNHCELIMVGIKQGAVDFLEKPLNPDKLKNIWQHVVRRQMMSLNPNSTSSSPSSRRATKAPGQTFKPTNSDPSDGPASSNERGCALAFTHGSGSNTSSSDRAKPSSDDPRPPGTSSVMDMMMEMDLDTSSFLDAFDKDTMALPLSELFLEGIDFLPSVNEGRAGQGESDLQVHLTLRNPAPTSGAAPPLPAPRTEGAGSGTVAVGHSCGQLPPLPSNPAGMVWGIPTQPLKIVPKSPLPPPGMMGLPPPLPFPFPPLGMGGRAMTPPPWNPNMMGMPPLPFPPPPGFMMPFPPLPGPGSNPAFPQMRPGSTPPMPFPIMGGMMPFQMPPPMGMPMPPMMPPRPPSAPPAPQMTLPPPTMQQQQQQQATQAMNLKHKPDGTAQQPPAATARPMEASPLDLANSESDDGALIDMASPALLATDGTPLIGLNLRKTGSFLDLISENLSSGGQWNSLNHQLS